MSNWEKVFSIGIRLIFVFAFGAFLYASINHIAVFFHSVEPTTNTDMNGSYALAISVDGTALLLTIGVMFFSKKMELRSKVFIWAFIVALTGFSWVVNWEYAVTYQSDAIIGHLDPTWKLINPILASSFAFLNLAYSIVAEVFNAKEKTDAELDAELDALTGERATKLRQIREAKKNAGPGLIERVKQVGLEAATATKEVIAATKTEQRVEVNEHENAVITPALITTSSSVQVEQNTDEVFHIDGTKNGSDDFLEMEVDTEPFEEVNVEELVPEVGTLNGSFAEVRTERITGKLVPQDGSDTDPEAEVVSANLFHNTGTVRASKSSAPSKITRRKPMTVKEVSGLLNVTERQVRNLRSRGILIQDDNKLITVSSVNAFLSWKEKVS